MLAHLCLFFSGQEFWEQQKQLEEQRERREKEKLEALKKKDKHEHSAVASHEVKRKLMVSLYHTCQYLSKFCSVAVTSTLIF
jgi:histone deacetylase 4/5